MTIQAQNVGVKSEKYYRLKKTSEGSRSERRFDNHWIKRAANFCK